MASTRVRFMPRVHARSLFLLVFAFCSACSDSRVKDHGRWTDLQSVKASLGSRSGRQGLIQASSFDTTPQSFLRICGVARPDSRVADLGFDVCVVVALERGQLSTVKAGDSFTIDGSTTFPDAKRLASYTFAPNPGHAPLVRSAWVESKCFGGDPLGLVTQKVRGRLRVSRSSSQSMRGHVELDLDGKAVDSDCISDVEIELAFDTSENKGDDPWPR